MSFKKTYNKPAMISIEAKIRTEVKEHGSYKFQGKKSLLLPFIRKCPRQVYTIKKCIPYKFIPTKLSIFFSYKKTFYHKINTI